VALRVVNDSLAAAIVRRIKALGPLLRPNTFIIPNTDATGKPSVTGAGGVGYDDMVRAAPAARARRLGIGLE